jgi:hypothetical protein
MDHSASFGVTESDMYFSPAFDVLIHAFSQHSRPSKVIEPV